MKRYVVIAGVNGAGKTTLYSTEDSFSYIEKINLDETVRLIGNWKNSSDIKKAAEISIKRIAEFFENGVSFSQETTLCGKSILRNLYRVSAKYFGGSAAAHVSTTGTRAFAHKIYPDLI